jgi:Bacterial transglutaminase-like cysteine proteinase BTLCP
MLIQSGWPREALLVTVVRDKNEEGHAVLTVTTNKGDYVSTIKPRTFCSGQRLGTVLSSANRSPIPTFGSLDDSRLAIATAASRRTPP